MNNSINHRELTYKALAGLAGGAIGWLPVELASNGRNLTDVMSTADIIASYVTMAILSGLIGGLLSSPLTSRSSNSRGPSATASSSASAYASCSRYRPIITRTSFSPAS